MTNKSVLYLLLIIVTIGLVSCGDTASKKETQQEISNQYVLLSTDFGDMKILLYDSTPVHRDNFIKLVKENYYDSLLIHRVIPQFMFQGGDPQSKNAGPDVMLGGGELPYDLPAEINRGIHKKGALAAARLHDSVNPERRSSSCQFFIIQGASQKPDGSPLWDDSVLNMVQQKGEFRYTPDQLQAYKTIGGRADLDGLYTVFGEVVEGLDVIDKIAAQPTGPADRPLSDIRFTIKMWKE